MSAACRRHAQAARPARRRRGGALRRRGIRHGAAGHRQPQADEQAERIRAAVAKLHPTCGDTRLALSVSIGVATLQPPMARSAAQLLAAADAALYRAKRNGRNQVVTSETSKVT
nr:GGDEF domain-containing protein [Pseudomonas sp. Q2-TVG4-2]